VDCEVSSLRDTTGSRLPTSRGSEQTSSKLQLIIAGERDKNVRTKKQLHGRPDQWSDREIIAPLADAYSHGPDEVIMRAKDLIKRAIRAKVLESYRNGQAVGPRKAFKR
jgi:hypothetical protein